MKKPSKQTCKRKKIIKGVKSVQFEKKIVQDPSGFSQRGRVLGLGTEIKAD